MKILVLGGGGAMAQVILRDLAESDRDITATAADLNLGAAKSTVSAIGSERLTAEKCDVKDEAALKALLKEHDVVVNATWYELNLGVMNAAIEAGIHYIDLGGLYHMTRRQLELDQKAKDAGVLCLLGMGSTPGTMNVMAAAAASKMDTIRKVDLRSGSAVVENPASGFQPPYSFRTVLDEFSKPAMILRGGRIQEAAPLTGKEKVMFPDPLGEMEGYYTLHSELATLPQTLGKGVSEMDFIVAYPPDFTRTVAQLVGMGLASDRPIAADGASVRPRSVLISLVDSLPKSPGSDLDIDIQRVDMYGTRDGEPAHVRFEAVTPPHPRWKIGGGTVDTGVPPSIAAQWIATGRVQKTGVMAPESAIQPLPFFEELGRRGIHVSEHILRAGTHAAERVFRE